MIIYFKRITHLGNSSYTADVQGGASLPRTISVTKVEAMMLTNEAERRVGISYNTLTNSIRFNRPVELSDLVELEGWLEDIRSRMEPKPVVLFEAGMRPEVMA